MALLYYLDLANYSHLSLNYRYLNSIRKKFESSKLQIL